MDKLTMISTHPDPVLRAIETFKNHPSIAKIKILTKILRKRKNIEEKKFRYKLKYRKKITAM